MKAKLEVCVDSVESAVIAQKGGADRLEVCANLVIGGTTPGISQFKQIRKACDIELNVLIRPRFGDFLYTDAEFQMITEDILTFRELGADGIVAGCLLADGTLDTERLLKIRECAGNLHMTLHRAFDVCKDPGQALEASVSLGIDTILTSGQEENCMAGRELLQQLIVQAADKIEILAGGGVNAEVIEILKKEIGAYSFHMSGKQRLNSGMSYRNERVSMGLPGLSEFDIFRTELAQIQRAREAADKKF